MAETPNHKYNVPNQGQQDWHVPLNDNFEAFEVDIELRDKEANLGDYTPTDGAKFLATDTGVVYVGDGNNWNPAFISAGYDPSADEATFTATVVAPTLDVGSLTGQLTGGTELTSIAGTNLSIDSNGQLNASTGGGGGGGISSLSGGDGIDPDSIGDGDTVSVAWGDASNLDSSGAVTDWSGATDLDSSGAVASLSGSLTGGTTLTDITGNNLSIDSNGTLNATTSGGGISGLSGGNGIDPDSIGDGDTVSVAWGDAAGLGSNGEITGGNWTTSGGYLEPSDNNVDGIDVEEVRAPRLTTQASSFEVFVSGKQVLELTSESGSDSGNFIAGYSVNGTDTGVNGAVIGGGGREGQSGVEQNSVTASYGTIGGGADNEVSGKEATIAGGQTNKASGDKAAVGGGEDNQALGPHSTVAGGDSNVADGETSTVGGGNNNSITGEDSTIAGGTGNNISEDNAAIAGGNGNEITNNTSAIGGGALNKVNGQWGVVAGGESNTADANHSAIGGGLENRTLGRYSTVAGGAPSDFNNISGTRNVAADNYCTVGGGSNNRAGTDDGNPLNATHATVSGGKGNRATAEDATVGGGENNKANAGQATVGGGGGNEAGAESATIGGGDSNAVSAKWGTVPGGQNNKAGGSHSFAAGRAAKANEDGSFVVGDHTTNQVSSTAADQAVFQQELISRNTIKTGDSYMFSGFPNISIETFNPTLGEPQLVLASGSGGGRVSVLPGGSLSAGGRVQSFGDDNGVAADFSGTVIIENLQSDTGSNVVINADDELAVESSSARHKTNIQSHATSGNVLDLQLHSFEYEDTGSEDVGLIAEEVENHVPEIVTYDDEGRPYGVKYDRVGLHLVPEVRENRERLDDIEEGASEDRVAKVEAELETKDARLDDQRDRIERLESRVQRETETADALRKELTDKDERIDELEAENEQLRERLTAIEERLDDIA
ncbi:hypothetical protein BRC66_00480 [Halobacteriales archaeon QH_2_66_30]|nr:MAG: hypothetical protein BRC66_00480 [Halobacteriales archaeon QH_2_66_30]